MPKTFINYSIARCSQAPGHEQNYRLDDMMGNSSKPPINSYGM